jgi:DNA-binding NarL/FixJ family response regulator
MSYTALPPGVRTFAERELTQRQLVCLKLELAGWGRRRIASYLGVDDSTVRYHLSRAHAKLEQHPGWDIASRRAA